jgi:CHAT domain-containing protein
MFRSILILTSFLFLKLSLSGQCTDRDSLWHRIIYLRDSCDVPSGDQLRELSSYLVNINDCPYRHDSTHALLLARMGWLFSKQNDFKNAISFTNQSIDIIHLHIRSSNINEKHLIKYFNNLAILYDSTGQDKLKFRAMDSCIALAVKLKTGYEFAMQHIWHMVKYNFGKGDYYKSMNYALIGEDISRKDKFHTESIDYYIVWRINSLIYLHEYNLADSVAKKAMAQCIYNGNTSYIENYLVLLAFVAEEKNDSAAAIFYSKKSLSYNLKSGNFRNCAATLNNLALYLYFLKLHNNDKALQCYKMALKYGNSSDSIEILNNIATLYAGKNDFKNAFLYFKKAFSEISPGKNEMEILNIPAEDLLRHADGQMIIKLSLDFAEAYIKSYRQKDDKEYLQSAITIFKSVDRLMNRMKIYQAELSSKLFWRNETRRLYENAIEAANLSANMESAFYFFEKSRAVILNDQLTEQKAGDSNIILTAISKKQILDLEKQAAPLNPDSKEYSDIQRSLFIYKEQLRGIEQGIRDHNPWYYQSLIDTNFTNLKEVQTKLIGDKAAHGILEFFNGDSAVYLLTITSDKSAITRINKTEFEDKVDKYAAYLSNPTLENQDYQGFVATGQQLYSLIFRGAPVPEGRIIISPDGKYFPLEALVINSDVSAPIYFLNNHIVSYTYSVRFLLNDFTGNKTLSSGNFLGLAPVQYPSSFNLASLSESDVSLNKISSYFGDAKTLIASQASKNNFMHQFYGYKMIQLYTHASDSNSNGEPVIYFADSTLSLSELIPENKTAARLIVLSACETGNGKLYKGEGVFSFNRGFAALGIPSSVINLWSVENESTYQITELFYKYVSKGLPLDVALQRAKLDFIDGSSKQKKLPYYWAAAILAGKTDAVELSSPFKWQGIALISGLLLIAVAFYLIKSKRRRGSK